ncbi:MAG: UPF0182 family protein, partial [Nocardiopsaceae bacterium]|nr:UPF0182 family protein [Nocardiopsaceae bacterium]
DPYPVIAGGRILWVIDGYTTTDDYPYSRRINLNEATSNTYSPHGLATGQTGEVNYIRNSVKATVDAFSGAVHIYQWGKGSPILESWKKSFPGLIQPQNAIPTQLFPHLRYPEVMFDAQRLILTQYHVEDPAAFYAGQNFWAVPSDPSILENLGQKQLGKISQPPYYLTLNMPGSSQAVFSLTSVLTFQNRPNMAAYLAVNSKPGDRQYGQITVLQLPQNQTVSGPGQIQNQFENFTRASKELTQLRARQGGSRVTQGNLVTVPLGGGLLSVEPVYVLAGSPANSGSFPQLKRVFTYFDGQTGSEPTLTASLADLFGSLGQPPTTGPPTGPPGGQVNAQVLKFLQQADKFYARAQSELKAGRLDLYYRDILKMKTALDQARNAAKSAKSGEHGSPTPTPSPSPTG